jgi:uncharacterized protein YneF (UPF0154 family)
MDPTAKAVLIAAVVSMVVVAIGVYIGMKIFNKSHSAG